MNPTSLPAFAIATSIRLGLYLAFLLSTAWVAFLLVRRGLEELRSSARWMATVSITLFVQHALFGVVDVFAGLGVHLLRPWFALPLALLLAVLAHRHLGGGAAVPALREDFDAAVAAVRDVSGSSVHRLLIAWGAVAATARALAGLVSPPLTWDTLTYHAVKSAEWVQSGFRVRTLAPDQWGYLTYYPEAAEEPAAWSMLFLKSDLGLPFVGIAQWCACGFGVYALARALRASRQQAFRAAAVVAFLPALLTEMVSGYADMFVLFAVLAVGFALVLLFRRFGRVEAMLLGASAGLLASAKFSGLPIACVAMGGLLLAPPSVPRRVSRATALSLAAAMALVMAAPHYLPVWIERGSPFYPLAVNIGSWSLGNGNPQLRALFAGELVPGDPSATSGIALLRSLVVPFPWRLSGYYMGFGPALLLLIPLAGMGLFPRLVNDRGGNRREQVTLTLLLATIALLPVAGIMTKAFAGERAVWLSNLGRLLLPLPGMLAVLGATVRSRAASPYLATAVIITMLLAWPGGIGPATCAAIWALAPWLALALLIAVLALVGFARVPGLITRRRWGLPLSFTIAGLAFLAPLAKLRSEYRYAIYEAAATAPALTFIMHTSSPRHSAAWRLWQAADDGIPHRIAASYGWNGVGDNWFRYPLLGSQLQNRVLYVPIARGAGTIIDYQNAGRAREEADEVAWLGRLYDARIDLVFLGNPAPPEREFVLRHPETFQLVGRAREGASELYRLRDQGTEGGGM
jgi:hypothetical protein